MVSQNVIHTSFDRSAEFSASTPQVARSSLEELHLKVDSLKSWMEGQFQAVNLTLSRLENQLTTAPIPPTLPQMIDMDQYLHGEHLSYVQQLANPNSLHLTSNQQSSIDNRHANNQPTPQQEITRIASQLAQFVNQEPGLTL